MHQVEREEAYALVEAVAGLLGREEPILIAKIDAAGFHDFNEGYGYDVGDQVLAQIAHRLDDASVALVSRTGLNEFALARPLAFGKDVQAVNAMVRSVLSQPFVVAGATINIGFAMGYVIGNPMADAATIVIQFTQPLPGDAKTIYEMEAMRARTRHRVINPAYKSGFPGDCAVRERFGRSTPATARRALSECHGCSGQSPGRAG